MPQSLLRRPTPEKLDLGLKNASALSSGSGWVDITASASHDKPLTLRMDAGAKLTPDWAAYGNAWAQPGMGEFGGGAGLRYRKNLDLFVEGSGNSKGNTAVVGGLSWRF